MQYASNIETTGMVAVVGLDEKSVNNLCNVVIEKCGKPIAIGNYLGPKNYALSGHFDACNVVKDIGRSYGAKLVVPLAVAGAFHSAFMNTAVPLLEKVLHTVDLRLPRIPVFSNVNAQPYRTTVDIQKCLLQQVVQPVMWSKIVSDMVISPTFRKCYEIGPGTVCKGTVKSIKKDAMVESIS